MVDSNYFPEYIRELTIEEDHIILNYSKLDSSLKMYIRVSLCSSLTDQHCHRSPKTIPQYPKLALSILAVYGIVNM